MSGGRHAFRPVRNLTIPTALRTRTNGISGTVPVPDLDAGLAFYRGLLGHELRWRNDTIGAAGLALAQSATEVVLTTEHKYEPNWLVESVDAAAAAFRDGGGRIVLEAFDIPVGRIALVADPFENVLVLIDLSKGRYATDATGAATGVSSDAPTTVGEKAVLRQQLARARAHLLSKLVGQDEEQVRRPMTPTGTNLLGLVKHVTGMEMRICDTFGRERDPFPGEFDELWLGGDMWAGPDETTDDVEGRYRRTCATVDDPVDALGLDATGEWMGRTPSLRSMLVGVIAETTQHGGHADIVRELLDGATGGPAFPVAGDGAYLAVLRARMRGEVGPEAWDPFRTRGRSVHPALPGVPSVTRNQPRRLM